MSVFSQTVYFRDRTIRGKVISNEGIALEYVNISIEHANLGTMSFRNGFYELEIPSRYLDDTLTFSYVGYSTRRIAIRDIEKDQTIEMFSMSYPISEVVITAANPKRQKIGITMHNSMLGIMAEHNEWAIFMSPRKLPAKIEKLNLYLNWVEQRDDSLYFRINFYTVTDSMPGNNLLMKNIVIRHLVQKGWNEFDLRSFNVIMAENFFVSIEWLTDLDKKADGKFHYGGVLMRPRRIYRRNTSIDAWQKFPSITISINLEILLIY